MHLIAGKRRTGKTTALIRIANENDAHMVVLNRVQARLVQPKVNKKVFTHQQVVAGSHELMGLPKDTKFCIDDCPAGLQNFLPPFYSVIGIAKQT